MLGRVPPSAGPDLRKSRTSAGLVVAADPQWAGGLRPGAVPHRPLRAEARILPQRVALGGTVVPEESMRAGTVPRLPRISEHKTRPIAGI